MTTLPQSVDSILPTKRKRDWRLVPPALNVLGEINGFPQSRGKLFATDGILCIVVRSDGSYFEGHVGWFVPDEKSGKGFVQVLNNTKKAKETQREKKQKELDELLKDFLP